MIITRIEDVKGKDILLDSNILVYSSNTLSPNYKKAVAFRDLAVKGFFRPVIAHQNIFESIRILTHPKYDNPMSVSRALKQIESFRLFCRVISPQNDALDIALALIKECRLRSNQVFDAYLAAAMISHGVFCVASDNVKDFSRFSQISVFNPLSQFTSDS